MEGWMEEEIKNRDLMTPCGLYSVARGFYIATRDGTEKFKGGVGNLYGTKAEETECCGCMQPEPSTKLYSYCAMCAIRNCVQAKGYHSCHPCGE